MTTLPESIESERSLLRPYRMDDIEDILTYAVEESWSRHMPIPYPYQRKDAEEWIAKLTLRDKDVHASWALTLDEKVIGGVDLIRQVSSRSGSLGYSLSPAHWNKGLMTEAVGAVIDCAFENLEDLNRIWAWADARNGASIRVMEKLGMTREGCLRQHNVIREEFVDAVHCGILREEWQQKQPPADGRGL